MQNAAKCCIIVCIKGCKMCRIIAKLCNNCAQLCNNFSQIAGIKKMAKLHNCSQLCKNSHNSYQLSREVFPDANGQPLQYHSGGKRGTRSTSGKASLQKSNELCKLGRIMQNCKFCEVPQAQIIKDQFLHNFYIFSVQFCINYE